MIVCRKCGYRNGERDSFCGSCGGFLEWTGEKVAVAVEAAPEQAAEAAPPARKRNILDRIFDAATTIASPQEPREDPDAPIAGFGKTDIHGNPVGGGAG